MYRQSGWPPHHSRSTTTTTPSRNGFPKDEEDIYHENYRLAVERERAGKDDVPPETQSQQPDHSRKQLIKPTEAASMDGPPSRREMEDTTGSPPKRLLKWPTPHLATPVYSEMSTSVQTETKREQKSEQKDAPLRQPSHSKAAVTSKRNTGKCDPPLIARCVDPSSAQVYRSSEKSPLLLRQSTKKKAEQTRFVPSPYQDAPIEKVYLLREEQDSFAIPFLPPSVLTSTHVALYLSASEQRRALVHPIKTREIRSIRLIVLPPLHSIFTRTNECGGELLSTRLLLSPLSPFRARRLRPIWETLVPLHASGHHVAVPFTLTLTPPFTVHRIATRVQKLEVVNARSLYRHSPVFSVESARALSRQSARLTTVEKEDPQMVRVIQMDQLFPTRMITRTTLRVKKTEVFHQGTDLEGYTLVDKERPNRPTTMKPVDYPLPSSQVPPPPSTQNAPRPLHSAQPQQQASFASQYNPPVAPKQTWGRQEVSPSRPVQQGVQQPPPRESERRKTKRSEADYNVFVRDASAHKEKRGGAHVYDEPGVKETTPSARLPPLPPQQVNPPAMEKSRLDDFAIPSRPLPTMASLTAAAPPLRPNKTIQTPLPPPIRPSSAETLSEMDQPAKPPRTRTVLPPPPPNVPLAPPSAESSSYEPLIQPKKKPTPPPPSAQPQPQLFQRDKKAAPSSQPISGPPSQPPSESADPPMEPPRRLPKTSAKPRGPSTSMSSTLTTTTPNATSRTPAPPSSQPPSGPPPKVGYINIIQPSSDTPQPKSAPLVLPVADGTQKSSSSGKNKKLKPPSEGSDSGGANKVAKQAVAKKDKQRAPRREKKSGSNKKSKFGPRGHEQMEELGKVRLVADAVKAGEIEADPNTQDAITRLIKKATTPLGGKKKKKKKSSK